MFILISPSFLSFSFLLLQRVVRENSNKDFNESFPSQSEINISHERNLFAIQIRRRLFPALIERETYRKKSCVFPRAFQEISNRHQHNDKSSSVPCLNVLVSHASLFIIFCYVIFVYFQARLYRFSAIISNDHAHWRCIMRHQKKNLSKQAFFVRLKSMFLSYFVKLVSSFLYVDCKRQIK